MKTDFKPKDYLGLIVIVAIVTIGAFMAWHTVSFVIGVVTAVIALEVGKWLMK